MDSRTRDRLPILPVLVRTVNQRRPRHRCHLGCRPRRRPGDTFIAAGRAAAAGGAAPLGRHQGVGGATTPDIRRDLGHEEEYAFWAWATVNVLRA